MCKGNWSLTSYARRGIFHCPIFASSFLLLHPALCSSTSMHLPCAPNASRSAIIRVCFVQSGKKLRLPIVPRCGGTIINLSSSQTTILELPSSPTPNSQLPRYNQNIRNHVYRFEDLQIQSLDVRTQAGTMGAMLIACLQDSGERPKGIRHIRPIPP